MRELVAKTMLSLLFTWLSIYHPKQSLHGLLIDQKSFWLTSSSGSISGRELALLLVFFLPFYSCSSPPPSSFVLSSIQLLDSLGSFSLLVKLFILNL